jgi:hypothetical protein
MLGAPAELNLGPGLSNFTEHRQAAGIVRKEKLIRASGFPNYLFSIDLHQSQVAKNDVSALR